jgi:ABC-type branched-subunit amino acid transport system substrate-binding protein
MAAYDAMELLISIMREAGSADPAVIREGLMALGAYEGASGHIVFGNRADPSRGAVIVRMGDGMTHLHKVVPPPDQEGG